MSQARRLFAKVNLQAHFGNKKSFLDLAFESQGTNAAELEDRRRSAKQDAAEDDNADDEFEKYMQQQG